MLDAQWKIIAETSEIEVLQKYEIDDSPLAKSMGRGEESEWCVKQVKEAGTDRKMWTLGKGGRLRWNGSKGSLRNCALR